MLQNMEQDFRVAVKWQNWGFGRSGISGVFSITPVLSAMFLLQDHIS